MVIESQQCRAKAKATGERCRRQALMGATVCIVHGGAAPQVKAKARERVQALVHPAITRLSSLLESDDERIALAAVRVVLDRSTDELGDPLSAPLPSPAQVAEWIQQLEDGQNG